MNTNLKKLLASFILLYSLVANANNISTSLSYVGMSMDYREYANGTIQDSEQSDFIDMMGVDMGLAYRLSPSSHIETNFMALYGTTQYIGSNLNTNNPYGSVTSTTNNLIIDFDVLYKRSQQLNQIFTLNYGVGMGYRRWDRELSANQLETYEWFSLRSLLGLTANITPKIQTGMVLEYQYGFNETMSASNLGATFDLGGADIFKVSVPLTYKLNKTVNLIAQYSYEEQKIKASNVINGVYEPQSTAKNQYLQVGIEYNF